MAYPCVLSPARLDYATIVAKPVMPNSSALDAARRVPPVSQTTNEPDESFGDILSQYERTHSHRAQEGLEGIVVTVSGESVMVDIGYKTEGILPLADFQAAGETVKAGDK